MDFSVEISSIFMTISFLNITHPRNADSSYRFYLAWYNVYADCRAWNTSLILVLAFLMVLCFRHTLRDTTSKHGTNFASSSTKNQDADKIILSDHQCAIQHESNWYLTCYDGGVQEVPLRQKILSDWSEYAFLLASVWFGVSTRLPPLIIVKLEEIIASAWT